MTYYTFSHTAHNYIYTILGNAKLNRHYYPYMYALSEKPHKDLLFALWLKNF